MKYRFLFLLGFVLNYLAAQTVDSVAMKQVDSLLEISSTNIDQRNFENAFKLIAEAEKICSKNLGQESKQFASCCFYRGLVHYHKEELLESEKWFILAKSIYEKVIGKENYFYARCLKSLSDVYYDAGNYEKSEVANLEELYIREKTLGKSSPEYLSSANNLASLYASMGKYNKSETLNLESKTICEKAFGKEHPAYIKIAANLGILYFSTANYEKAEPLLKESLLLREKTLGREHPDYAYSLMNLAVLYRTMGAYSKAETLLFEGKEITGKVLGKKHSGYLKMLLNLGGLYLSMGNYKDSESIFLEVKEKREETIGKEHPDYANCLNNLAVLNYNMGNYEKAEQLSLEIVSIREKTLGKDHPDYAASLNNLAVLYNKMGKKEKSEQLYFSILGIVEKSVGKKHLSYALYLDNLADLYYDLGRYKDAEIIYLQVNEIHEEKLGKEHPDYASGLEGLGEVYSSMAQYEKAEKIHLQIGDIRKKVLGKEHPDYANHLFYLANIYETQDRFAESENLLSEYFTITNFNLIKSSEFLSEQELAKNLALREMGNILSTYLYYRQSNNNTEGILPSLIYDQVLFRKGFLLNSTIKLNNLVNSNPEAMETNNRLKGFRRRLAKEFSLPIAERDSSNVADLEESANNAEKQLARNVAGYAEANRQLNWKDVQLALTKLSTLEETESAAIEFVHFNPTFPKVTDRTYYAALLILPGSSQPRFITLFEENILDSLLKHGDNIITKTNSIYASRGANPVYAEKVLSKSLFNLIWQPLEQDLKNVKTIYFSPSGRLSQLNLGAIAIDKNNILSDKYKLVQLGSTRQVVIPTQIKNANNDAVLFGGIQFEKDSTLQNSEPLFASRSRGELSFNSIDSTLRGGTWNYLAGTEREVNSIEKLILAAGMKVNLKKGYQATEESFKNIGANNAGSPRILHIATHGYFFPDPKSTAKRTGLTGEQESVFKISDHPMLRSGLIMAGGNAAWQGKQTLEGREDGILTAYEISQMNLSNTELVVLSACETGLGEIQGNEGVYGLQRAFKIAGAKYLIMSLWQVPDKQTSLLMTTFYKKYLEEKLSIPDAFHAAQKELRDIGLDPYQWAGFVLVE